MKYWIPNITSLGQGYKQIDAATKRQLTELVAKMKKWVDELP
jgi:hypothetical protein